MIVRPRRAFRLGEEACCLALRGRMEEVRDRSEAWREDARGMNDDDERHRSRRYVADRFDLYARMPRADAVSSRTPSACGGVLGGELRPGCRWPCPSGSGTCCQIGIAQREQDRKPRPFAGDVRHLGASVLLVEGRAKSRWMSGWCASHRQSVA